MTAITYPRSFPTDLPIVGLSFMPEPFIEVSPTRGGDIIAADLGPTLWRAKMESPDLDPLRFGEARAWYGTLLNIREFYAYDILRQYPVEYQDAGWTGLTVNGGAFDGTGYLESVESNNVEVSILNVPIGFILRPGDYMSWAYSSTRQALHRVSAAVTATGVSGSGEFLVEVHPAIRTGWAMGATVQFYRPVCKMIIMPGSYQENIRGPRLGQLSFEAIQSHA